MNVAIVDDEPAFFAQISKVLKRIIKENELKIEIECFDKAGQFYKKYERNKYDVLFLDIDMPEMNGFELTEILRNQNDNVRIVYITNRDNLVIQAFRYKIMGFVRKQHIEKELQYAMSTILKEMKRSSSSIVLTEIRAKGGRTKSVAIDSIIYIEIHAHDAYINLANGEQLVVRKSISEFLETKGFENFVLINSGTIVNLAKIKLEGINVILPDNNVLFISKRKMKDVRDAYLKSLRRVLI